MTKYGTSYQNKMKKWICNLTFDTKYAHGGKTNYGKSRKTVKASNLNLFTDQISTLVTLSRAAIINSQGLILLPFQIALVVKLEH